MGNNLENRMRDFTAANNIFEIIYLNQRFEEHIFIVKMSMRKEQWWCKGVDRDEKRTKMSIVLMNQWPIRCDH